MSSVVSRTVAKLGHNNQSAGLINPRRITLTCFYIFFLNTSTSQDMSINMNINQKFFIPTPTLPEKRIGFLSKLISYGLVLLELRAVNSVVPRIVVKLVITSQMNDIMNISFS